MVWKSLLPYRVEFEVTTTRVERPHLLEGQAVGELEGIGRWRLYEQDGVTAVLYEWNVATTKPWMNRLAPLLRPVFEWNHDWVMAARRRGDRRAAGLPLAGDRLRLSPSDHTPAIFLSLALSARECQGREGRKRLPERRFLDFATRPLTE